MNLLLNEISAAFESQRHWMAVAFFNHQQTIVKYTLVDNCTTAYRVRRNHTNKQCMTKVHMTKYAGDFQANVTNYFILYKS